MHVLISPNVIQWLIAAGIFYALSSVFVYGKQVYNMINDRAEAEAMEQTMEGTVDVGIRALNWATMLSYVICTISLLGALITAIVDQNSSRNYSGQ